MATKIVNKDGLTVNQIRKLLADLDGNTRLHFSMDFFSKPVKRMSLDISYDNQPIILIEG